MHGAWVAPAQGHCSLQTDWRGIWWEGEVFFLKAHHGNPLSLFGSSRCFPALMAAIAAVTLKRPARFVLTREVDTSTTGHRCLVKIDNVTQFYPGTRQAQTTNSVSTALGNSSQLDLIWQSMLGAPATSQSPGLTP